MELTKEQEKLIEELIEEVKQTLESKIRYVFCMKQTEK